MAQVATDITEWVPTDSWGLRLAMVRQVMGWNTSRAAEECGLKEATWRGWEAGVSPQRMERRARAIADRTGCSYTWLLAGGPLARTGRSLTLIEGGGSAEQDDDGERAALTLVRC